MHFVVIVVVVVEEVDSAGGGFAVVETAATEEEEDEKGEGYEKGDRAYYAAHNCADVAPAREMSDSNVRRGGSD